MQFWNFLRWLNAWRKRRRVQTVLSLALTLMAPVLVVVTYLALRPTNGSVSNDVIRLVLLADFVYVLVVAALIANRIVQ
ncbi:MAG: hypothetical protein AAF761_12520, partial [Pseudomonadota bacterium]